MLVRAGFVVVLVPVNFPGFRPVLARGWHRERATRQSRVRLLSVAMRALVGVFGVRDAVQLNGPYHNRQLPVIRSHPVSAGPELELRLSSLFLPFDAKTDDMWQAVPSEAKLRHRRSGSD
jgi:hypothetical protein